MAYNNLFQHGHHNRKTLKYIRGKSHHLYTGHHQTLEKDYLLRLNKGGDDPHVGMRDIVHSLVRYRAGFPEKALGRMRMNTARKYRLF